jgi:hypothetical protein
MGFIAPHTFTCIDSNGRPLRFEAVQLELIAHIEASGLYEGALAVRHPFVVEAVDKMNIDQFQNLNCVVFDESYLNKLPQKKLEQAFARSARTWR